MKRLLFAVAAATVLATPALAADGRLARYCEPTLTGWHCDFTAPGMTKAETAKMYAFLKKVRYPGVIQVTTPADYKAAIGGWKTRGDCKAIKPENKTRDWLVNHAKFYYCDLSQKGWPVPKPKIVKLY